MVEDSRGDNGSRRLPVDGVIDCVADATTLPAQTLSACAWGDAGPGQGARG